MPNDDDVEVELLFLAVDCVSYVDEAIEVFRDRAGVGDHNLPHFDGVVVLKNETGDLRLMKVCKESEMMLLSQMKMAR